MANSAARAALAAALASRSAFLAASAASIAAARSAFLAASRAATASVAAPNLLAKRCTRPPESISFCWPVKNGWQALQMSTRISDFVERVWKVLPQVQVTVQSTYSGWISFFIGSPYYALVSDQGEISLFSIAQKRTFARMWGLLPCSFTTPHRTGGYSCGRRDYSALGDNALPNKVLLDKRGPHNKTEPHTRSRTHRVAPGINLCPKSNTVCSGCNEALRKPISS